MAFIGHRCSCGHNDLNHKLDTDDKQVCTARSGEACGEGCDTQGDPELMPTFDRKGRPIERILAPGDALETESGVRLISTCECDACRDLYEQLAVPAAV
ncbi:hypothetical protein AB0P02_19015 [Streptomyces griseoluteus]|uniref:hypothetical protein n=1 Tax=Streptomyces griseoluteus TaxID=29306 RepID=UPI00342CB5B6